MNWFDKLFLVKTIVSKAGVEHFKRWQLLSTPWFSIFLHKIMESDEDRHPHDHPFSFISLILSGGYFEYSSDGLFKMLRPLSINYKKSTDFHKLVVFKKPTWTLVFAGARNRVWGYDVNGTWIEASKYRKLKNSGEL